MIAGIFSQKTEKVSFAAGILAISSFFSLILGFVRNNLLSTSFPSSQTDIFFAAFRLPDLVYGILITGGIASAFLPVFSAHATKGKKQAESLANNVLNVFFLALAFLSLVLAIFAPFFINFLVPGFDFGQKQLTIQLIRIMFLSPILLGISAIFSGMLQYQKLFFACAVAPIFYNLGIIAGILFFYPLCGLPGLAFGVILGAFLHLTTQFLAAFKSGFRFRFGINIRSLGLKKIFKLMVPRTIGSLAYNLNLIIITAIASTISAGAISIFNYSDYLYGVPVSLIGISFATAAFPSLSKDFADRKRKKFMENFYNTFRHILFFIIPLSFLFFILRVQIVRLIFGASLAGGDYFNWWLTRLTSASVGVLAFSLVSACCIPFLARVFFSFHDSKTPMKIAVLAIILNTFLSYFFVWALGFSNFFQKAVGDFLKIASVGDFAVVGLSLAVSISSLFQFFLLLIALKDKVRGLDLKYILFTAVRFLIPSVIATFSSWASLRLFALYISTQSVAGIFFQTLLAGMVGVAVYFSVSLFFSPVETKNIRNLLRAMLVKIKR